MLKIFVLIILFFLFISAVKVYGGEISAMTVKKLMPYVALPSIQLNTTNSPQPSQ